MVTFIKLEKTLAEALLAKNSVISTTFENRGVQLKPGDPLPYRQITAHPSGIELEDWTVEVYNLCGDLLGDITDNFLVLDVFDDDDGIPQIRWQLTNLPEFEWQLIYLKITQSAGEDFFSTPFMITDYEIDYTTRTDYKDGDNSLFEAIRLRTHFRQDLNKDELLVYYETSTGNTVTLDYKASTPELWWTDYFNNSMFVLLRNMLNSQYLYFDLVRCNLFEAFEIPKLKSSENFAIGDFLLSFSRGEVYDPLYVEPIPETLTTNPVTLKIYRRPGGDVEDPQHYMANIRFTPPAGFDILSTSFSSITINGEAKILSSVFFAIENGTFVAHTTYSDAQNDVPFTVDIASLVIRMTNAGGDMVELHYGVDGEPVVPAVNFSAAEIYAHTEKTVLANIIIIT